MDCVWKSIARTHMKKLQVVQSKCLRVAINAHWYVSNKHISQDFEGLFFAGNITTLKWEFQLKDRWWGTPITAYCAEPFCWKIPETLNDSDWNKLAVQGCP
jgi:hypothetical protein